MATTRTTRAILTPLLAGCALLASPLLVGCPADLTSVFIGGKVRPTPEPAPSEVTDGVIAAPDASSLLIKGSIKGPAALGNGTRIVSTGVDDAGDAGLDTGGDASGVASGAAAFRAVLATTAAELPVQGAVLSVKGYDFKIIPQVIPKTSDDNGEYYFKYVPARLSFFLEAEYGVNGKTYRMLGLTRTNEPGVLTNVTVDLASTLVARELLRIWQLSEYRIAYKDLSPKDFNPLLVNLRRLLKDGMPAGVMKAEDVLATVNQPDGKWSIEADREDGAVFALDTLARQYRTIDDEVERLYTAANFLMSHDATAKRQVSRPPHLN